MSLVDEEGPGEEGKKKGKVSILRNKQENAERRTCEEKREIRRLLETEEADTELTEGM